jgi:hypothetical protein
MTALTSTIDLFPTLFEDRNKQQGLPYLYHAQSNKSPAFIWLQVMALASHVVGAIFFKST